VNLPLVVSIEGRPKFHAEAGVFKGRKAVQVREAISIDRPVSRDPAPAPTPIKKK
jgi:flagellar motor switch protein FliM